MAKVRVSDHALVRYLERVGGFEIEALRAQIEERVAATYIHGAPAVVIDGCRFIVKLDETGPVVATIFERGDKLTVAERGRK